MLPGRHETGPEEMDPMHPATAIGRAAFAAGLLPFALAVQALAVQALAQPAGDAAKGRRLAEALCARCHVVASGGGAGWTDAPAFPTIAADPRVNAAWLRRFFAEPHLNMLYTDRPPAETADIAAYILSLRPR